MIKYGFYNSLNGDRKYNCLDISDLFSGLISDGIFMNIGKTFIVKENSPSASMDVSIDTGKAWFDGRWIQNDAQILKSINAADLLSNRIDAIVIEINKTDRVNSIKYITGELAEKPTKPTLVKSSTVTQYPLAYITVKKGVTKITQADIENAVGTSACPYVTGIIKTVDIDNLVAQWDAEWDQWTSEQRNEFNKWFADLQTVLDGDVAANLTTRVLALEAKDKDLEKIINNLNNTIADITSKLGDQVTYSISGETLYIRRK